MTFSSPKIIRVMKAKRMRGVRIVAGQEHKLNALRTWKGGG